MIRYIISKMMGAEGLLMLLPMMVGIIYGEHTSVYFLITAAILTAIYLLFGRKCPENMTIYAKEGLIIVATAWIFWSLAGALPFVLSKSIPSYVDAFFETVSGFTTTGSTILTEIEGLPKGILFWRSLTHWVGGMGCWYLLWYLPLWMRRIPCILCVRKFRGQRQINWFQRQEEPQGSCMECILH